MPKTITDPETGEEIEVYTSTELEERQNAAKEEAIEAYKQEHPDNAEEIERLQKELEENKLALDKEKSKDKNFSELRKTKDELEKKLSEAIGGVKKEVNDEKITEAIGKLANGDEELAKKIKFHFDNTLAAVNPKNIEERNKKVQDAYLLARGADGAGAAGQGNPFSSAGAGMPKPKVNTQPLPAHLSTVAEKMGITAEDVKKHDKQDFSNTK
jgi:hypothetical protein